MNINEMAKVNSRQVENLKKKQAKELEYLENTHQKVGHEIKKANDAELLDLRDKNVQQLNKESEKKEQILNQMHHQIAQTQKLTQNQIKEIKEQVSKDGEKLSHEREKIRTEHDLHIQNLNHHFNEALRDVHYKGNEEINKLSDLKNHELSSQEDHFHSRLDKQKTDFSTRFSAEELKHRQFKEGQENKFKKERETTNLRQQGEMNKLTGQHNHTMQLKEQAFKEVLRDQNNSYEKRFAESIQSTNEKLKKIHEFNLKVENKIKSDLQEKIEAKLTRSEDPFYQFTELNPQLKQFEDRIEINVDVPEYSKNDLYLTIHDKEAILNFNRRYDDSRKEANINHKVHKVESFTTRLRASFALNPKSIQSHYENGVMTYTIMKS